MLGLPPFPMAPRVGGYRVDTVANTGATGGSFEFELPVPGGGSSGVQWAYAAVDPDSGTTRDLVLSVAYDGDVYLGTVDLSSLDAATATGDADAARASIAWARLELPPAATARGYTGVADHAHVHGFGSHWISAQLAGGAYDDSEHNDAWLFRVERADVEAAAAVGSTVAPRREALVYSADPVSAFRPGSLVQDFDRGHASNDHFLVVTPSGVALAIVLQADKQLRLVVVDPGLMLARDDVAFAGRGPPDLPCDTTGSASGPSAGQRGRWRVIVPDSLLLETDANTLRVFDTDENLSSPLAATYSGSLPGASLQMPSFVTLGNGDTVLATKLVPCSTDEAGPKYPDDGAVVGDWGHLVVALWNEDFTAMYQVARLLVAGSSGGATGYNRPHVSRWGRWLITCWDEADLDGSRQTESNHRSKLRVDLLVPT